MLMRITEDLWETPTFSPFPGLTTHAYLWTPRSGQNILFYSPGDDGSFDEFAELGGVAHQYLSHQDEAGPVLAQVRTRFGSKLHGSAAETEEIGEFADLDVAFTERHVDGNGVEVIPTPGHTPGSVCYLITSADGRRYLFTGDTIFRGADHTWSAGFIPGMSDAVALTASLNLLTTLDPDVVVSSAFAGDSGVNVLGETSWAACVKEALGTLPAHSAVVS